MDSQPSPEQAMALVARQKPAAGAAARSIEVWLVPLCGQSADPGPPPGEPILTPGPTELVSGLFLDGGPPVQRPTCQSGPSSPGTITVFNVTTGATVASSTVASGKLATFPLAPGSYTIEGTFPDATVNGVPIQTAPQPVTIPAGVTVRQDIVANIP